MNANGKIFRMLEGLPQRSDSGPLHTVTAWPRSTLHDRRDLEETQR